MTRVLVGLVILVASVSSAWFLVTRSSHGPRQFIVVPGPIEAAATVTAESWPDASSPAPTSVLPEAHPWSWALCPSGMVWVGGRHCPKPADEGVSPACVTSEHSVGVCMDAHEYPSQVGTWPAVMLDHRAAVAACEAEHKRLCTEIEWTFACLSVGDVAACNSGHSELEIRTQQLARPERVSQEIAAHEGRRPSSENACVNRFRVFDLLGNVQEWVSSDHRERYVGALKGGRYNQSSIGCGRSIYVSDPWTRYPHTGLRCCAEPLAAPPTSP